MSIEAIRFRAAEAGVILQVCERGEGPYQYDRTPQWRDAKVEDMLEVANFTRRLEDERIRGMQEHINELYRRITPQEQP